MPMSSDVMAVSASNDQLYKLALLTYEDKIYRHSCIPGVVST